MSVRAPRLLFVVLGLSCACLAGDRAPDAAPRPLRRAHAHNDYEHAHPLVDALAHGFCSVEADVFLVDGRLLVGHTRSALRKDRTLESLYLGPLRARVRAHHGRIYPGGPTVYLLIDVKTAAQPTYTVLARVLARYADILSRTQEGRFTPGAVTVVISGNRDKAALASQAIRFAGYDGRRTDLDSTVPAELMPWLSDRWGLLFHWNGTGPMPAAERNKLREFVRKAHDHGRLVRFWGTPERADVWRELVQAGVDLINTDQLAELQQFLEKEGGGPQPVHSNR